MSEAVVLLACYAVGCAAWAYFVYRGDFWSKPRWMVWAVGAIWPVATIFLAGALIKQKFSTYRGDPIVDPYEREHHDVH